MKTSIDVTWDTIKWTVQDEPDSVLMEGSCQAACENLFSFKVDRAGFHIYSAVMINGGESLKCVNKLSVFGKSLVSSESYCHSLSNVLLHWELMLLESRT